MTTDPRPSLMQALTIPPGRLRPGIPCGLARLRRRSTAEEVALLDSRLWDKGPDGDFLYGAREGG